MSVWSLSPPRAVRSLRRIQVRQSLLQQELPASRFQQFDRQLRQIVQCNRRDSLSTRDCRSMTQSVPIASSSLVTSGTPAWNRIPSTPVTDGESAKRGSQLASRTSSIVRGVRIA